MVQQESLINKLKTNLPKNLILVAPRYFGKKTLVSEITDISYVYVDHKIDAIREIDLDGNYIFTDIDDWNVSSYSALLKHLEEGTGHNIITCRNILNLPESIHSRCIIESLEPYKDIPNYCDSIGQLEYYSDELLSYIDKFQYKDDFDLDVFFSVACNRLLERVINGEQLTREFLITSKYNSEKNLKNLNKKQFIANWQLDIDGLTESYKRF